MENDVVPWSNQDYKQNRCSESKIFFLSQDNALC